MYALAIHGGAGNIDPNIEQDAYLVTLDNAVNAGHQILEKGGPATDAVCASITVLENSPLFNAGHGAVFNHEGDIQLDASLMEGNTQNAGAVCAVRTIKNPILAAQKVLNNSPHVLLTTDGAEAFSKAQGLDMVENSYFHTERRYAQLKQAQSSGKIQLDFADDETDDGQAPGTVGAVALDQNGLLAAGTSTGGLTNKAVGRVGDTPLVGAGTYAHNDICAISCTGTGDEITRIVMAYDIACQMQYQNKTIEEACQITLDKLAAIEGVGGLISITADGQIHMPFNSRGMFRGSRNDKDLENNIAIF